MRKLITVVLMAAMCCSMITVSAQAGTKKPAAKKTVKPAATNNTTPPKEVTIQLVNDCEKNQLVYAGPKKEVFHGKYQEVGGASTNTIHIKSGDVVCIIKDNKSVKACTDVKIATTKIEINKSGNGFVNQ